MAEGDTIYRIAAGLRPHLVGRAVVAARTTTRAQVARLVGTTIESIETVGKNLLIHFSGGLTVRTHLRMRGTWHTYSPGEPWRYAAARAVLVLEIDGTPAALSQHSQFQSPHPGTTAPEAYPQKTLPSICSRPARRGTSHHLS